MLVKKHSLSLLAACHFDVKAAHLGKCWRHGALQLGGKGIEGQDGASNVQRRVHCMSHTGAEAVCAPWQRLLHSALHARQRGHTEVLGLGFAKHLEGLSFSSLFTSAR